MAKNRFSHDVAQILSIHIKHNSSIVYTWPELKEGMATWGFNHDIHTYHVRKVLSIHVQHHSSTVYTRPQLKQGMKWQRGYVRFWPWHTYLSLDINTEHPCPASLFRCVYTTSAQTRNAVTAWLREVLTIVLRLLQHLPQIWSTWGKKWYVIKK